MKVTKYYYSKEAHIRKLPVVTDQSGEVLYVIDHTEAETKKLPRITVASVLDKDENKMYFGVAVCSPKDMFSKQIGRDLAFKRAIETPDVSVYITRISSTRNISKRYANTLIAKYLEKYV